MKKFFTMLMLSGFVFGAPFVFGQDEAAEKKLSKNKEDLKSRISQYIETGIKGVFYDTEKDVKNGNILRLFVVGTAVISTAIGVEEGLEIASEKADETAKIELLKFLETKASFSKNSKGELIISKEGEENGDGEGDRKEGIKKIDKRSTEYKENANGCIKGLKVAGVEHKGKNFIAVYRLETSTLNSIDKLKKRLNTSITGTDSTSSVDGEDSGTKAKNSKVIPNKRVIIVD
ncbi:MAG: hypothetical protein WCJ72_12490 [Chryseobacterium sp.]